LASGIQPRVWPRSESPSSAGISYDADVSGGHRTGFEIGFSAAGSLGILTARGLVWAAAIQISEGLALELMHLTVFIGEAAVEAPKGDAVDGAKSLAI